MGEDPTFRGACLCGAVRLAIRPPTLYCGHCHCSLCRRAHGAAFVTWVGVPGDRLSVEDAEGQLARYRSSEHGTRSFCRRCGSALFYESATHPDRFDVVRANLEGEIDRAPQLHVFFDDRVDWFPIDDALPKLGDPAAGGAG
jgi:hypothetical protein